MEHFPDPNVVVEPLRPGDAIACEAIARQLPAWFGIEEGLVELRKAAETQPGVVARINGEIVGFATVIAPFPESREISWMAVAPDHRGHGIGRRIVDEIVARASAEGARILLVKTLADLHPSPEYAETRAFYQALGFLRIEVLPELWRPENPCLVLARPLSQ